MHGVDHNFRSLTVPGMQSATPMRRSAAVHLRAGVAAALPIVILG